MAHDENFDIAEEVARGLAMRSHEAVYVTPNDHNGSTALVNGIPYNGYMTSGSYFNYMTPSMTDENYVSSMVSSNSDQGIFTPSCPSSTRKRGAVGRKPPKGPDGMRRYSSRRATFERRDRINSRERDRMHQLCDAFERLRQVLPCKRLKQGPHRQKLSKISTLLLAQNYIRALELMLQESPDDTPTITADLDSNGFIVPQGNIPHQSNQDNGHSNAYYSVGEATGLENSLGTVQYSYNTEQLNSSYTQEFYKMDSTTQYQYL